MTRQHEQVRGAIAIPAAALVNGSGKAKCVSKSVFVDALLNGRSMVVFVMSGQHDLPSWRAQVCPGLDQPDQAFNRMNAPQEKGGSLRSVRRPGSIWGCQRRWKLHAVG